MYFITVRPVYFRQLCLGGEDSQYLLASPDVPDKGPDMPNFKSLTRRVGINRPDPGQGEQPPIPTRSPHRAEEVNSQSFGFAIWYEPDAASHLFDIIFIHGLTGDRNHTWTHSDHAEPWPKTMIPNDLPRARILSYGYDAYNVLKKGPVSNSRLSNHSLDFLNALVALR